MLLRLDAEDGVALWGVVLCDDRARWADLNGPGSPSEALADLRTRGEVREVDWPDDA